ncbi:MAG: putative DNA-binding regulatory protein, partial [bacterium]|nr:putative DNA-binding regulatory protein [bacterium]
RAGPELAALVGRARRAWPDLPLDDARFAAYLAARSDGDEPLHVEDLYLACACVDRLPRALAAFDEHHLSAVARSLSRVDRSPAFADEVRQRLRERLLVGSDGEPPRLASYSGRGPLATWVKVAAIRLALNLRRDERADASLDGGDEPMIADDAEMLLLRRRFRSDFSAAFAAAVATLTVEQRQLLRLHFLDALSLGEIGALHGVDKSTVSRRLLGARGALLHETERWLRARLNLAEHEVASMIRLIRSQLGDVSVARLLRAAR